MSFPTFQHFVKVKDFAGLNVNSGTSLLIDGINDLSIQVLNDVVKADVILARSTIISLDITAEKSGQG